MSDEQTHPHSTVPNDPHDYQMVTAATTPLPNEPYYQRQAPQRTNGARRAGIALIVVGLLWLALQLPGPFIGFGHGRSIELLDQTYPAARLEMDVGAADVIVEHWSGEGLRVEAVQRGGARGDVDVQVDRSGDTLQITNQQRGLFNWFGSPALVYTISVPDQAAVQIETTTGDIRADALRSDNGPAADLHTVSGDIALRDVIGDVTVNTTNGDVVLQDIAGQLNVVSVNGSVELDDGMVRNVSIHTTSGDIDLHGVADHLQLESVNGDISVHDASDATLAVSLTNGSFEFAGSLAGGSTNTVSAVNGDIEILLPKASGFTLQASTIRGDLALKDFEPSRRDEGFGSLTATVGDGATQLNLTTTNGDIVVAQQ